MKYFALYVVVMLFEFGTDAVPELSDYAKKLLEVDASIHDSSKSQWGFPVLPPPRTTRQTAGTGGICVPAGTCLTTGGGGGPTGGGGIDPRIVTPGQNLPQSNCPAGQVLCFGLIGADQCGQRFATGITQTDGPSVYGAFPWQAFIRNQTGYTGSGVLVDNYHVLTAAHKVNLNVNTPGNIQVYIGVYDPATSLATAQMRTVASMVIHESFDAGTLRNDIAVLRLSSPISLGYQTNVGAACLPASSASYVGQRCVVSGWGKTAFTANDAPTSPQKQVFVPIVSYDTCRASMAQANVLGSNVDIYLDPNGELCAGGEANRDACTQDGGSALVCQDGGTGRFNIAGLVIWGKNCGQPGVYGAYVDVAKYRAWIDGAIGRLSAG